MGCQPSKPPKKPMKNPYVGIHQQVNGKDKEAEESRPRPKPMVIEEISIPEGLRVSAEDFDVGSFIQEGGVGKVYSAVRKSDGKKVAMKLFGYTARLATPDDIQHEIDLMAALKGVTGFIQTEGVFWDTEEGLVPESKQHNVACPVIVMELMEGGELFDRMHAMKEVSEKYIARIFKSIIIALDSMHKKCFVHRDFKLENAMMVTKEKDSPVRIIDFGMVCKIPSYTGCYRGATIQGTPGYVAPESILYHIYSAKTDLWQAGCTLYSLLSGLLPFSRDDYEQVTHQRYFPMKGVGWDNISDEAKDLVRKILTRRPERRIDAEGILNHPWMVSEAPDVNLGDDYFARIKQLALRQKLKCFFLDSRLEQRNQIRRTQLQLLLPFISSPSPLQQNGSTKANGNGRHSLTNISRTTSEFFNLDSSPARNDVNRPVRAHSTIIEHPPSDIDEQEEQSNIIEAEEKHDSLQSKLKHLKDIVIPSLASKYSSEDLEGLAKSSFQECSSSQRDGSSEGSHRNLIPDRAEVSGSEANGSDAESNGTLSPPLPIPDLNRTPSKTYNHNSIDYPTFQSIMDTCGLPQLGSLAVFKIFDLNHTGNIDLKDFLLTMIAFREDDTSEKTDEARKAGKSLSGSNIQMNPNNKKLARRDSMSADTEESARLYFNVFDYKENGVIDKEELRTVLACILQDQVENISEDDVSSLHFNAEDLFDIIDTKKNGHIDYEEFKQFYEAVLTNTNTRCSILLDKIDPPSSLSFKSSSDIVTK